MEKQARHGQALAAQAIDGIAHKRVADPGKMDANLMGAPGDRMGLDEAECAVTLVIAQPR